MTARELLVEVAGVKHVEHTVVERRMPITGDPKVVGMVIFLCSCGVFCEVVATRENLAALQNVPQRAS